MMTNTPQKTISHEQQSQLAKLLAMENITVQHQASAKTAMFDVKNRVLILPVWREMSKDLYDMLVIHEVGHALDTPAGFVKNVEEIASRVSARPGVIKGFLNVIEDARIDKRQKRRYPGSRRNYIKGYAELIERDFFGTATRDVNSMSFIDRINIYFKAGAMSNIKFSLEEKQFLSRIDKAETFDEVLDLVEEIYLFAKDNSVEREDDENEDMFEDSDEGEESDDDSYGDYGDSDEEFDDEQSEDEGNDSDEGSDEEQSDEESSSENSDDEGDTDVESKDEADDIEDGSAGKASVEDDVDAPETEKAWEKKQEELLANSDIDYVYVNVPSPTNIADIVDDYKVVHSQMSAYFAKHSTAEWLAAVRSDLNAFRTSENATISYMVKEFEMRKSADEYQRTATAKTGSIDTNKLFSYKYNDDVFKRITSVAEGKNHGFVMFVDWSGSMDQHLKKTIKQLFSLVWFCKRVQIPFEVYSFRSINQIDNKPYPMFSMNAGDIEMKNFKLRNMLSSRMNVAELNTALFNLWAYASGSQARCDNLGSTPLNEAIAVADRVINMFKARSKVQVVNTVFLTDGESDGNWSIVKHNRLGGRKEKYIIVDPVTKKNYDLGTVSYGFNFGKQLTNVLLKIVKDRTHCNLIGFYVFADGFRSLLNNFYGYSYDKSFEAQIKKEYEANGFVAVTNAGYDEYYILRPSSMEIQKNDLKIDSSMTKRNIAKAFMSFAEKKAVNRVLLQRLVKRIAA